MAEEGNIPVSPLDELGPQYGNLDLTNPDPTSYQAFEGDVIMDPELNVPATPPTGLYRPQQQVRQRIVGTPPVKPPIQKKERKPKSRAEILAFAQNLSSDTEAHLSTYQPKHKYGGIYSYNDGPDGDAFYERYAGYGDEKVRELGFHPFRDNESIYNESTTGWDDMSRMLTNSFMPLVTRGFVAGPKSLYKMAQGDFSSDTEDAEAYERAAAIGQSSKGGLGSFFSNTLMNFGYTAGIMTEALVEEAAIGLLAPATGGASLLGTGAVVGKLGKNLNTASKLKKTQQNLNQTLNTVNTYKGAKNFWTGTRTGRFLNPIENITEAYQSINKVDNLTSFAKGTKYVGAFYRDTRNLNMALSEARLEGGFVKNKIYNRLYEDYYRANGVTPNNDIQWDFTQQANTAATEAMIMNTALIFGTNKIVFPNIVGPRGGIKNFLRSKVDDIKSLKDGTIRWRNVKGGTKSGPKFQAEYVNNGIGNTIKSFYKDPLRKSARGAIGYFKANIMEGVQEVSQEIISGALEDYYVDSFKQQNREAFHFSEGQVNNAIDKGYFNDERVSAFKDATLNQFGSQGFETFASGFFMGMFAGPINAGIPLMSKGYNKFFGDKKQYEEYKKTRNSYGKSVAANLNALYADPVKLFNSRLTNYSTQNAASEVKATGTIKENNDATDEAMINMVNTSLEQGSFDIFIDHLDSMKELPANEFEKAFGFEKGTGEKYQSKIDNLVKDANQIKKDYDFYTERFPNPVDLNQYPDNDSREYRQAAMLSMAWKEGIKQSVFFKKSYNDVATRIRDISSKLLSEGPLENMTTTDLEVLLSTNTLYNELSLLNGEIAALEGLTDQKSKDLIKEKQAKVKALEEFQKVKNEYEKHFKSDRTKETKDEEKSLERTIENDNKITNNLENAYNKYIKFLGKVSGQNVFSENLEKSFEDLKDIYELTDEKKKLVGVVNMMHNPDGFIEHVQRNEEWMTKIYNNRKKYFDDIVKSQMEGIESNAVLNALYSQQGLMIEPAAFRLYMQEGTMPEYFIDVASKQVYPKGTKQHVIAMALLTDAKRLREASEETVDELDPLTVQLEELKAQKEKEISNLPSEEIEVQVNTIKTKANEPSFKVGRILEESIEGDKIIAKIAESKNTMTFIKQGDTLVDENGNAIEEVTTSFTSAKIIRKNKQYDPKLVSEIEKKYKRLEKEIVENFDKNQETSLGRFTNEPTATNLRKVSPRVYTEVFEEMQQDEDYGPQYKESTSQQQKNNLIDSYIRDNFKSIKKKLGVKEEVKKKAPEKAPEKSKLEQEVDALKAALANEERLVKKNLGTPQIEVRIKELKQEIAEKEKQVAAEKEEVPTTDKKADIERRRQEELGTKESRSYTIPDSDSGVTTTVTISKTNEGKKVRVSMEKDGEQVGQYFNKYPKELSNEKIYEVENAEGYEYTPVKKLEVKGKRTDKINAKYDAELAALEEAPVKSGIGNTDIEKALDGRIIDEFSAVTSSIINGKLVPRTLEEGLLHIDEFLEKTFGWSNVKTTHKIKTVKDEFSEGTKDVFTITADGTTFIVDKGATGTSTTSAGKTNTFTITLSNIVNAKENAEEKAPVKPEVKKGEQDPEATKIELSENEAINKRVEKAKAAIAKAEANELSNIMLDLSSKYGNIPIQIQEEVLFPLVEERFKELSVSTKKEETKLEGPAIPKSDIYKEGTTLIVTGKIRPKLGPGKWNYDKLTNSTVTIEKMTKDGAELNIVINGKNKKYSATFGELEKNYTLPVLVNTEVQETKPMTKQQKTDVKKSNEITKDFLSDSKAQNKALEKAENTTIEDAKNNLRNNLKCRKK